MQSTVTTVAQYLAALPADRRVAISKLREVILKNLDADYEEGIQYGMIGYYVPHRVFPAGYHCNPKLPLPFVNLGSQKNYMSLHLMPVYVEETGGAKDSKHHYSDWFRKAWTDTGKKLDMGKACVRFKKLDDVPLEVVGEAIQRMPAAKWIKIMQSNVPKKSK